MNASIPLEREQATSSYFAQRRGLLLVTLVAMFVLAAAIRTYRLEAPGVLVDREYTSAMFSRAFYFEHAPDVPAWRRTMATTLMQKQPTLEPPVTEWLTAVAYRVLGREDMRLGRLLTSAFWLAGGVFFFQLARLLTGPDAAVVALGYFLFLPLAVLLSRTFQADALMMLMFIASLLAIVRQLQLPSGRRLALAAVLSALTLVYRPLVMPALLAALVLPSIQAMGWRRGLFGRSTLTFVAVAALPAFAYYGYASFVARYFQWKLTSSFMFSLYGHREYWQGWFELATSQLGIAALLLALAGLAFLPRGLARSVVAGLGVGYLCFGLAFTYHIHTHGYYQAQLIPAVGIALGPVTVVLVRRAVTAGERWLRFAPIAAGGVLLVAWGLDIGRALDRWTFERPAIAAEIGARVNHSDRVVFLSPHYGLPLQYLGEFTGAYWPRRLSYWLYRPKDERERTVDERLASLGFEPEFFVITHWREYENNHADLRTFLERRCAPLAQTQAYHIYGRCELPSVLRRAS